MRQPGRLRPLEGAEGQRVPARAKAAQQAEPVIFLFPLTGRGRIRMRRSSRRPRPRRTSRPRWTRCTASCWPARGGAARRAPAARGGSRPARRRAPPRWAPASATCARATSRTCTRRTTTLPRWLPRSTAPRAAAACPPAARRSRRAGRPRALTHARAPGAPGPCAGAGVAVAPLAPIFRNGGKICSLFQPCDSCPVCSRGADRARPARRAERRGRPARRAARAGAGHGGRRAGRARGPAGARGRCRGRAPVAVCRAAGARLGAARQPAGQVRARAAPGCAPAPANAARRRGSAVGADLAAPGRCQPRLRTRPRLAYPLTPVPECKNA